MSKARSEDGWQSKNYITPGGYARLKEELMQLLDHERPEVVKTVAWAAANGDRSENADYIYGKRRLREIDRRIRFLSQRLDAAEVVNPADRDSDQVFFGATVTVSDAAGNETTHTIVGVDESDPALSFVSWVSPIAKALMKSRVGDLITVSTPSGDAELEVLNIEYKNV